MAGTYGAGHATGDWVSGKIFDWLRFATETSRGVRRNNFGAATYSSEEGWQNRALTMTSKVSQDAKAAYAANRFVYSITGKDTFTVDWQISRAAPPNWIPADHLAYKRRVSG